MVAPPTYVPLPSVLLDGRADENLAADILSVLVEETTDGLARCEVRFRNYGSRRGGVGYRHFGRDVLDFGKEIALELGEGDRRGRVFLGRITALEAAFPHHGGGQLLVLAEDRLQDLRMTRRTRSFEDVSDADVIEQIARAHGLQPELDLDGPTHRVLAQVNQSDLAFLRERARAAGAELWVEGTNLFARARPDRDAGTVNLEYGANLHSFVVRADLAHQRTEVGVGGWDVAAKESIDETASESTVSAELGSHVSGGAILAEAFAERKERIVHTVPLTSAEARALAEGRYRERARRFVTGTGRCDGDGRIRVGSVVNVADVGSLFEGAYTATRVRQMYDEDHGFLTELDVERPGLGPAES